MADDRNEARHENGEAAISREEGRRLIQMVIVQQDKLANLVNERLAAEISHDVRQQRSDQRTDRSHDDGRRRGKLTLCDKRPERRHHHFRRDRHDHRFQRHQEARTEQPGRLQYVRGPVIQLF